MALPDAWQRSLHRQNCHQGFKKGNQRTYDSTRSGLSFLLDPGIAAKEFSLPGVRGVSSKDGVAEKSMKREVVSAPKPPGCGENGARYLLISANRYGSRCSQYPTDVSVECKGLKIIACARVSWGQI